MSESITVKKIDNGYVIEAWCEGESQAEYVKNISKIPSVMKRMFGIKDDKKTPEDYDNMTKNREVKEEKVGERIKLNISVKDD